MEGFVAMLNRLKEAADQVWQRLEPNGPPIRTSVILWYILDERGVDSSRKILSPAQTLHVQGLINRFRNWWQIYWNIRSREVEFTIMSMMVAKMPDAEDLQVIDKLQF